MSRCDLVALGIVLAAGAIAAEPKVLLIAYDGMRYDYINAQRTPFLWRLAQKGVFAPGGIQPQTWTVSSANFYSMSTGLHVQNHGIIGNVFYDPHLDRFFDYYGYGNNAETTADSRSAKWFTGEPIWQVNERASPTTRASGAMRWPFCDAPINERPLDRCQPFEKDRSGYDAHKADIDELIGWFADATDPINFGLYYNEQPDREQHSGDIYRQEVVDVILHLDKLTEYLFARLEAVNLLSEMNVILLADHGHANVHRSADVVNLDEIINKNDYTMSELSLFPRIDRGSHLYDFFPQENVIKYFPGVTARQLYAKLKDYSELYPRFDVFMKEDVPDKWHYKENRRVGPVVIVEKLGTWVVGGNKTYNLGASKGSTNREQSETVGKHGYSQHYPEMRPFFIATGPAFKQTYRLSETTAAENIDVYPLICHLLKVTPGKQDGKLERINEILATEGSDGVMSDQIGCLLCVLRGGRASCKC